MIHLLALVGLLLSPDYINPEWLEPVPCTPVFWGARELARDVQMGHHIYTCDTEKGFYRHSDGHDAGRIVLRERRRPAPIQMQSGPYERH